MRPAATDKPADLAQLIAVRESGRNSTSGRFLDHADIRDILKVSFEDGGFEVLLAPPAEEAIAALDTRGKEVRALVTDIKLGGSATGWDVARHARGMKPDMPVVYIAGSEGHEWASLGVSNSILVPKPFAASKVLTAVSQLLNSDNTPGAWRAGRASGKTAPNRGASRERERYGCP